MYLKLFTQLQSCWSSVGAIKVLVGAKDAHSFPELLLEVPT